MAFPSRGFGLYGLTQANPSVLRVIIDHPYSAHEREESQLFNFRASLRIEFWDFEQNALDLRLSLLDTGQVKRDSCVIRYFFYYDSCCWPSDSGRPRLIRGVARFRMNKLPIL